MGQIVKDIFRKGIHSIPLLRGDIKDLPDKFLAHFLLMFLVKKEKIVIEIRNDLK
jgi:hypothetical protein